MLKPGISYKTILLIDDDEDDCYLFQRAISKVSNDLKFFCTDSSDNLLAILENSIPFIIFIDLRLPKQNGLECLRLIRNVPSFKDTPIIFWSGYSDEKNIASAYNEGAQYFFEKPSNINDLIYELKSILNIDYEADYPLAEVPGSKFLDSQFTCYCSKKIDFS